MNDARTVWVGNIADQVTEELLYELFLQAGPLERVKIPIDREGKQSSFGFITFKHEISVPYCVQLLNGIKLFDKSLNVKPRNGGSQAQLNIQRSFSVPNQPHHNIQQQQNEYMNPRFKNDSSPAPHHVSYDDLLRMGQTLHLNFGPGENSFGNNFDHRHNTYRDRNMDLDRRDYDRPRNDRIKNQDYHSNKNHRRHHGRNNFDRNGGRRNHRHY